MASTVVVMTTNYKECDVVARFHSILLDLSPFALRKSTERATVRARPENAGRAIRIHSRGSRRPRSKHCRQRRFGVCLPPRVVQNLSERRKEGLHVRFARRLAHQADAPDFS